MDSVFEDVDSPEEGEDELAEFGEVVTQQWSCCGQTGTGQKYGPCPNCGAV
jgi:hypothetical protein